MRRFAVILAGGGGTRFWPLSRQNKPKQLLNISGNDIMINETISRCGDVIPPENAVVITNISQAAILENVLNEKVPRTNILKEPVSRNTSACVLYSALYLMKKHGDVVMAVLPSDHYISEADGFRHALSNACVFAENEERLVTIGIKPSFPATGFGYIHYDRKALLNSPCEIYEVTEFVEKPDFEMARQYLKAGDYFWNSGIFIWKASVIIDCFKRYLPRLFNKMMKVYDSILTDEEQQAVNEIYPSLQSISIDYGILERSDNVVVIPGDFGWNDVGSWDALGAIFPTDDNGNIVKARHVGIDTRNSIIYGNDRLIATIDMDNIIVAETKDALLVCPKNKAQDVRRIVDILREKGMTKYI